MSSELTINYKMDGGENRSDCLEFRNTVSEANFVVRKSVRYIRTKKFRARILGHSGFDAVNLYSAL